MKVLLRNHGVNLSGVKSDLYTLIGQFFISDYIPRVHYLLPPGIDSKHPSGIPSTVRVPLSFLVCQEHFFSGLEKFCNFV